MHRFKSRFTQLLLTGAVSWIPAVPVFGIERAFDSSGVPITYVVTGRGEPVVLIHGFGANIETNWRLPGILGALAKDYQVIAIENRGHGESGKPHDPAYYGMEMVHDVARLLDHLFIEKAHIVGYSMGGFITGKFRAVYPERCLSAVMGGAGWARPDSEFDALRADLARDLRRGNGFATLIRGLHRTDKKRANWFTVHFMNWFMTVTNDEQALSAVMQGISELEVSEDQLRTNKVPTLAVVGEVDPLKKGVDAMAEVMASLEVVVIPGSSHTTAIMTKGFRKAVQAFLVAH